jgi:hypothetical protein
MIIKTCEVIYMSEKVEFIVNEQLCKKFKIALPKDLSELKYF